MVWYGGSWRMMTVVRVRAMHALELNMHCRPEKWPPLGYDPKNWHSRWETATTGTFTAEKRRWHSGNVSEWPLSHPDSFPDSR